MDADVNRLLVPIRFSWIKKGLMFFLTNDILRNISRSSGKPNRAAEEENELNSELN